MKMTTKGRYAVMAMADLAKYSDNRPVSLADIASRQEISLSYLEQLFARLRRGGLVKSVRGPGGGYLLARALEETRISDIIFAVDEPLSVTRCKSDSPNGCMSDGTRCLTHDLWDELGHQIQLYLSSVSLEDIMERRVRRSAPIDVGYDAGQQKKEHAFDVAD
ncbi:MAG: Rrf2 family transcriptional regulator [Rhodobiaceae bacterium]|nr:MAG: Rrf2 family transcriptional regulator [Rhodobiaceae bacterium]